jgi:hypothetical protein
LFLLARYLLSLSKKSKWPIPIIFAPLKINNLQATENRKCPDLGFFDSLAIWIDRQPVVIISRTLCFY